MGKQGAPPAFVVGAQDMIDADGSFRQLMRWRADFTGDGWVSNA
jgi:hypothetical protein